MARYMGTRSVELLSCAERAGGNGNHTEVTSRYAFLLVSPDQDLASS
jgi:hypothetical protein